MIARLFSKIFKKEGIILIDHAGQKYICGEPRKEKYNPLVIMITVSHDDHEYIDDFY